MNMKFCMLFLNNRSHVKNKHFIISFLYQAHNSFILRQIDATVKFTIRLAVNLSSYSQFGIPFRVAMVNMCLCTVTCVI